MPNAPRIRALSTIDEREIDGLTGVLVDCVEGGASVGFMLPLSRAVARSFWERMAASAARGERTLLVAESDLGAIVGTVQIVPASYDNQPHRGDLVKMLVHRAARRQGVGSALLAATEQLARAEGRTLLVLDTASADAQRLYARNGWHRVGSIPNYALWPDGSRCATTVYYKDLEADPADEPTSSASGPI